MTSRIDNIIECEGALVLGGGIAGLFTALKLAPMPVTVLTGAKAGAAGSSAWAQGGIAAAMAPDDDWRAHAADTIAAGAGLCDPAIVEMVAKDAPARIADLLDYGAPFDRKADGNVALGLEAAHSKARIVHVKGDRAGAEISATLATRAAATPSIRLLEGYHAVELAMADGRVVGLFARTGSGAGARLVLLRASAVILATGGLGALYAVTTNPLEARGEGLGMAARAGALIADPEFVQFHPTAIAIGRDPAPLATEALRGEGATLVDERGKHFIGAVHADGELGPRDIVARAIHRRIAAGHQVFLDCRAAIGTSFAQRFPTVFASCMSAGIDPAVQPIPVAPAAHYHMGGIASDRNGRSSLAGLWVVGECAATGLHGANRLASNSLLEGLVFGARVAEDVRGLLLSGAERPRPLVAPLAALQPPPRLLREAMSCHAGLERDTKGLTQLLEIIGRIEQAGNGDAALLNITAAARLVAAAALMRQESRGSHWRSDFPQTNLCGQRSFLTLADTDTPAPTPQRRAL
ncbi:MAG: L-aspartate oxidase [Alphaproteobacteria bacterium]|nr:L-aspartate oxidase [Alphaproteobacteria bacterium]